MVTCVVAVLTGVEINPHVAKPLPMVIEVETGCLEFKNPGRYPLATDKVRHMGDPIAVVVAADPYLAADALEQSL
jgi:CO/xanthine dehydrogenase Mo-binding subunit